MFFERESLSFTILDVLKLDQRNVNMHNKARPFSALSFRLCSDTVLSSAGAELHLQDGAVAFVPAHTDYHRRSREDTVIVVHFDLHDTLEWQLEAFLPRHPEVLEALFSRLLATWRGHECGYRYRASALLCEILAECHRETVGEVHPSKIWRSVAYMEQHYADPHITVPKIARQSYLSDVYFRRLFHREFGTSPVKYLTGLRMQHAKRLLSTGYHTVKEVAYLSGYTDEKYFSVEFKRHFGISPSSEGKGEEG